MSDHNLWKNDITNRFSPSSLTDAADGDGFIATAIISSVTTKGAWRTTQLGTYLDLRLKLLKGVDGILPLSTTTQRDLLSNIERGIIIDNITTGRLEIYTGAAWISSAGAGTLAPAAYGGMFENNSSGSVMNGTTKRWITAAVRTIDGNGIVTFLDNSTGDRLVIGTAGAGDYDIEAKCSQTNAGGNKTILTLQVNGIDTTLKDERDSDSGEQRQLSVHGILTLAANDYISLHVVSSTSGDVITGYNTSVSLHRLS